MMIGVSFPVKDAWVIDTEIDTFFPTSSAGKVVAVMEREHVACSCPSRHDVLELVTESRFPYAASWVSFCICKQMV